MDQSKKERKRERAGSDRSLMGRLEEEGSSSKRRRRANDAAGTGKHLYLALDDWEGGYSIHKLDPDDLFMEAPGGAIGKLPEPAAVRIASPVRGPMAFAALGSNIFVATNPRCRREHYAPPTLVYDTQTSALTVGPRVPDWLHDLSDAMAVGEKLYAVTSYRFTESPSLQAMSWAPITSIPDPYPWDPAMEWSWKSMPAAPLDGLDITAYALHPDGRTLFMSSGVCTHSLDTSSGVWKELGDWVLPFRGQAYFDGDLDAWVGLHRGADGYICCCPVASRSAATTRPPECRVLMEKMFQFQGEQEKHLGATLTYMGDSRFCLAESVLRSVDDLESVLRVTVFGLRYDHKGELRNKVRRTTRSYAVSKNTLRFSHAAFWM
ncbi:hypothetical protein QOZ80_8BG0665620 [Eleusine coracana subsp. coracana]|nr:hypothetical protein QOZ80_8BG0665620 [Eleusine coracana subsp. coracana]